MPLSYILRRFAQKTGIACSNQQGISADADQRQLALDYINEGAKELYQSVDLPGSLDEAIVLAKSASQISIPSSFGELRALREAESEIPWKLSSMRPRYCANSWYDDGVTNWREKGAYALFASFDNTAPLKLKINTPDKNIVITVTGQTSTARKVHETVVMDETEKILTNSFEFISSIKKNIYSDENIVVEDADGNEVAVLHNDELSTSYKLVDASENLFCTAGDGEIFIELLFKKPFKEFYDDADEFPVPDYDDVILNKALQLWNEDNGNGTAAIAFDQKAERTADRKAFDKNKSKDSNRIEFQEHRHDGIFSRNKRYYYR